MATDTNLSCLLYGPLDARFENRPVPTITNPDDVIVKIAYTGVCGSDVHFWLDGGIRTFVSKSNPLTMGHEASGTIHAVGSAVPPTTLSPGDTVAIEPGFPCRHCDRCKAGRYNLCQRMKFAADPGSGLHGTLSRYFVLPADFCYRIPHGSGIGLREAVLVEPLAVAVHAVRLAGVKPGDGVVVFGAGTVGVFTAAVAREFGARVVVSVDVLEERGEFARGVVGEDVGRVYIPDKHLDAERNARRILQTHGLDTDGGLDVAIDASGAEASVQTAIYALRMGGTYVQAGMGKRKIEFPISEMCEKEITARGCFRYGPGDFKLGIQLASQGRLGAKLGEFVTAVFPFEKATEAWEFAKTGKGVKTVIEGPK